jgi:enoyl-CoA hydratase
MLDVTRSGSLAWLRLNRPQARNAMNLELASLFDRALSEADADPQVRVIVLSGAGPAFCAGQDLNALASGEPEAFIGDRGWAGFTARSRRTPVIAAVDGAAVGGGFELILACDLVVASTRAWFALGEVNHGLIAAAGGAARLPHRLPHALAMELVLTGSRLTAERAFQLGAVNRLVEPGTAEQVAQTLADAIVANPAGAVAAGRQVVECSRRDGEASAQRLAERLLEQLRAGPDAAEGVQAFAEGRAPRWRTPPKRAKGVPSPY